MIMGVDFARERFLGEIGWEEIDGSVGGVTRMPLQKREGFIKRSPRDGRGKEGVDDGLRLRRGCDEGSRTVMSG